MCKIERKERDCTVFENKFSALAVKDLALKPKSYCKFVFDKAVNLKTNINPNWFRFAKPISVG